MMLNKTDQVLKDNTGKIWSEWLNLLDKDNALNMSHSDRVSYIHSKYNVDKWWSQNISIRYERARGLKQKFEKFDGGFESSKSKTFNIKSKELFELIQKLIEDSFFGDVEITTLNEHKNIRAKFNKTTTCNFYFSPKENRTQLVVQHFKLDSSEHCEKIREFWNKKLKEIEENLIS